MRYGGYGSGYTYALLGVTSGGNVTVDHSTFSHSQWGGLHVSSATADVAHSLFTQNRFGASFYGAAATIRANSLISSNSEYGVFMTYTSSYASGPGVINNSEVVNNGLQGVLLWVDPGIATTSAPRGTGNNIYNNAGTRHSSATVVILRPGRLQVPSSPFLAVRTISRSGAHRTPCGTTRTQRVGLTTAATDRHDGSATRPDMSDTLA
jgi:hypothetical protein